MNGDREYACRLVGEKPGEFVRMRLGPAAIGAAAKTGKLVRTFGAYHSGILVEGMHFPDDLARIFDADASGYAFVCGRIIDTAKTLEGSRARVEERRKEFDADCYTTEIMPLDGEEYALYVLNPPPGEILTKDMLIKRGRLDVLRRAYSLRGVLCRGNIAVDVSQNLTSAYYRPKILYRGMLFGEEKERLMTADEVLLCMSRGTLQLTSPDSFSLAFLRRALAASQRYRFVSAQAMSDGQIVPCITVGDVIAKDLLERLYLNPFVRETDSLYGCICRTEKSVKIVDNSPVFADGKAELLDDSAADVAVAMKRVYASEDRVDYMPANETVGRRIRSTAERAKSGRNGANGRKSVDRIIE